MGKRKRDTARRTHKRPKPSSGPGSGSYSGGGGPARRTAAGLSPSLATAAGTAMPTRNAPPSTSSSGSSGTVGTTRTAPPSTPGSSSGGRGLAWRTSVATAVPPVRSSSSPSLGGGTRGGVPTPTASSHSTSPSASSGSAASTGGVPSPTPTPPGGINAASVLTAPVRVPLLFLSTRASLPAIQSQYDRRYTEAEKLLIYLETHLTKEADALWTTNKWHLKVDFEDFRRTNRPLSHEICNSYEHPVQSGKDFYAAALRTFLLRHFQSKSLDGRFESVDALKIHIESHANLSFTHMPKSITTFGAITKSKTVHIFHAQSNIKQEAVEAVPFARIMLCKIIDYILENHKKGLCWDGNWSLDDWEVINNCYVSLLKKPIARNGRGNSDTDLVQIASTILPTFRLSGRLPSFMSHLQDELNNPPLKPGDAVVRNRMVLSDKDFFDWFYLYLRYHPGLMSPLARSTLLQGFYFTMDKLDYRKMSQFSALFSEQIIPDWRLGFLPPMRINKVIFDVFWHGRIPDMKSMPHENTNGGMLCYHRHLVQHAPDHGRTKRVNKSWIQSMNNSDESELIAALHNEILLPEFIKKLFVTKKMSNPEFKKHWKAYIVTWSNES